MRGSVLAAASRGARRNGLRFCSSQPAGRGRGRGGKPAEGPPGTDSGVGHGQPRVAAAVSSSGVGRGRGRGRGDAAAALPNPAAAANAVGKTTAASKATTTAQVAAPKPAAGLQQAQAQPYQAPQAQPYQAPQPTYYEATQQISYQPPQPASHQAPQPTSYQAQQHQAPQTADHRAPQAYPQTSQGHPEHHHPQTQPAAPPAYQSAQYYGSASPYQPGYAPPPYQHWPYVQHPYQQYPYQSYPYPYAAPQAYYGHSQPPPPPYPGGYYATYATQHPAGPHYAYAPPPSQPAWSPPAGTEAPPQHPVACEPAGTAAATNAPRVLSQPAPVPRPPIQASGYPQAYHPPQASYGPASQPAPVTNVEAPPSSASPRPRAAASGEEAANSQAGVKRRGFEVQPKALEMLQQSDYRQLLKEGRGHPVSTTAGGASPYGAQSFYQLPASTYPPYPGAYPVYPVQYPPVYPPAYSPPPPTTLQGVPPTPAAPVTTPPLVSVTPQGVPLPPAPSVTPQVPVIQQGVAKAAPQMSASARTPAKVSPRPAASERKPGVVELQPQVVQALMEQPPPALQEEATKAALKSTAEGTTKVSGSPTPSKEVKRPIAAAQQASSTVKPDKAAFKSEEKAAGSPGPSPTLKLDLKTKTKEVVTGVSEVSAAQPSALKVDGAKGEAAGSPRAPTLKLDLKTKRKEVVMAETEGHPSKLEVTEGDEASGRKEEAPVLKLGLKKPAPLRAQEVKAAPENDVFGDPDEAGQVFGRGRGKHIKMDPTATLIGVHAPVEPLADGEGPPDEDQTAEALPALPFESRLAGKGRGKVLPPPDPRVAEERQKKLRVATERALGILETSTGKAMMAAKLERRKKKFSDQFSFGAAPRRVSESRTFTASSKKGKPKRVASFEEVKDDPINYVAPEDYMQRGESLMEFEEAVKGAVHRHFMFDLDPEAAMEEFGTNPDIYDTPSPSILDTLEQAKSQIMEQDGLTEEQWQDAVEDVKKRIPNLEKLTEAYAGPKKKPAKQKNKELEDIIQQLPPNAMPALADYAKRTMRTLQNNPDWKHIEKVRLLKRVVKDARSLNF